MNVIPDFRFSKELGVFVLTPRPEAKQGRVIATSTTHMEVLWFSWIDGAPTFSELFPLDRIWFWRAFRDEESWRREADATLTLADQIARSEAKR